MTNEVIINIRGFEQTDQDLIKVTPLVEKDTEEVIRVWGQQERAKLKSTPYPARRPGQRYIRTGGLGRSWAFNKLSKGHFALVNSRLYSSFVVGLKQAWMHVNRWWIAEEEIKEDVAQIKPMLLRRYQETLDRNLNG